MNRNSLLVVFAILFSVSSPAREQKEKIDCASADRMQTFTAEFEGPTSSGSPSNLDIIFPGKTPAIKATRHIVEECLRAATSAHSEYDIMARAWDASDNMIQIAGKNTDLMYTAATKKITVFDFEAEVKKEKQAH